jgi:hypothetical protein
MVTAWVGFKVNLHFLLLSRCTQMPDSRLFVFNPLQAGMTSTMMEAPIREICRSL